jgi:hypothetical protein
MAIRPEPWTLMENNQHQSCCCYSFLELLVLDQWHQWGGGGRTRICCVTCFYSIPSCNSELLHVLWNLLSCECAWSWVIRLLFARG